MSQDDYSNRMSNSTIGQQVNSTDRPMPINFVTVSALRIGTLIMILTTKRTGASDNIISHEHVTEDG